MTRTPEQIAEAKHKIELRNKRISAGLCPHCADPVATLAQEGRCIYAEPCGHRVGQGHAITLAQHIEAKTGGWVDIEPDRLATRPT